MRFRSRRRHRMRRGFGRRFRGRMRVHRRRRRGGVRRLRIGFRM